MRRRVTIVEQRKRYVIRAIIHGAAAGIFLLGENHWSVSLAIVFFLFAVSNTYFFIRPRWVLRFDGTELSFQDLRFGGKRETFDLNSVSSVRLNDPIKLGGRQNELLLTVEERVLVLSLPMMEQSPEEVLQLVKDRLPVVEAGV